MRVANFVWNCVIMQKLGSTPFLRIPKSTSPKFPPRSRKCPNSFKTQKPRIHTNCYYCPKLPLEIRVQKRIFLWSEPDLSSLDKSGKGGNALSLDMKCQKSIQHWLFCFPLHWTHQHADELHEAVCIQQHIPSLLKSLLFKQCKTEFCIYLIRFPTSNPSSHKSANYVQNLGNLQ